ncbi:hypothetical protein OEZ85_007880 [Tetradesmus obliquus]|uniref:Dilute domain-containing protein n=1 Tax=Tetradesmus obliquus TaxID=3088 RepID=A0ABY8THA5_TETOB|nr:hypothetical protein OEZ85_007880 [Tetradesmus obliquus]
MQVTTHEDTTCTTATPQLPPDHVRSLAKAAGILTSNWIDWLPSYGCALLALQPLDDAGLDLQLLPDHLALHLVCLDDWKFHMHSSTGGAICHTASSASHASLCCGHVPADNFSTLVQTMHTLIEQRRQDKAKAKDNSKSGFQRTPAFILAVIKDALVEVQQQQQQQQQRSCRQDSMPRGGFTDVGLHTGGMPRATAWPLVQQTLQVVLDQAGVCSQGQEPRSLFRLAMAHFELWLLQGELQQLSPATATAAKLTDCMVMLESVATKAAALAMAGHDITGFEAACFDKPSSVPASEAEVQLLKQVVDAYRKALLGFKATQAEAALMQVQLRSAEVLVVWVAYCMMFEASRRLLPVVNRYGVGLHWTDLRQLVLPDRLAVDAACTVSAYLLQQSNPERQLYSLHDGGKGTLSFAFDYAAQCEDLMEIWLHEQEQAQARVQARWVEVKRKQRMAVQLRKEEARLQLQIAELQPDIDKLQAEWQGINHQLKNTTAQLNRFGLSFVSPSDEKERSRLQQQQAQLQHQETNVVNKLRRLQQRQSTLKAQLTSTETQRLKAEQAPAAIIQPLPQATDCALRADVGVWYPDSLAPAVAWSGTGTAADRALQLPSGLFNPFVPVEQQQLAENFTEKLPATAGQTNSLQWAMLQVGSRAATPAERGNQGIASQDQKPSWLSKPGYLALTNLRSYPLSQLQRLCVALREQSLPLGHPVVLTMVKQAVMQIGELQQPAGGAALLTAAVSGVLQRAPSDLQWHQVTGSSSSSSSMASFQAVSRDRHLYSVNILDGTVLLDGVPPGRLPSDVLQHPLYRRTFGSCNFEVSVTQAGVWQTLRPINGRLYDFHWSASGRAGSAASQLVIEEVEAATGDRLQLLDVGEDGSCWGAELPVMLQQLYSHWYHSAHAAAATCASHAGAASGGGLMLTMP